MDAMFIYRDDKTCQMPEKQFRKLCAELKAGRGQAEMTRLIENGYQEFLAIDGERYPIDSMTAELVGF